MIKRYACILVSGLCLLSLNGCAWKSDYLQKAGEAETLTKNLDELQQRYAKLSSDNAALKVAFEKLTAEAAGLTADKKGLEDLLKAKSDTLSKNINEMRQKVAELESENRKLRENIAEIQKVKEEKVKEVSGTYEQLLANMKNEIAQGQVTISELKGKLTVNMEAAILFDSGKADVKQDGLNILVKMVDTLKGLRDKSIRIEGHTDNVQIIGGLTRIFPTNWELSAARAINVTRYLQEQGIDPANLSAAAFAEHKPVAANDTKEGKAKNRRIEITLVAKE